MTSYNFRGTLRRDIVDKTDHNNNNNNDNNNNNNSASLYNNNNGRNKQNKKENYRGNNNRNNNKLNNNNHINNNNVEYNNNINEGEAWYDNAVASNLSDIEKHQRKKNRGDYNEEGGSESDSTVKNGTTSNPSRNNNKRNRNTVGGVKVSNSLDNYGFVKEPRAFKTSNSNEESSGPNMSLVAYDREMVNPNPSGVAACDSWTGVLASNTLDDTRWVGLSTLHRRGDSLGESTQGVVPPYRGILGLNR